MVRIVNYAVLKFLYDQRNENDLFFTSAQIAAATDVNWRNMKLYIKSIRNLIEEEISEENMYSMRKYRLRESAKDMCARVFGETHARRL